MDCTQATELLSAELDGELTSFERLALEQHLDTCRTCQATRFNMTSLHRAVRVRPAERVPDLTMAILAKAHPPAPGRGEWVRYGLAVVALTQLVLAFPALIFGEDPGASIHVARHIGSLTVALAIGLAYAAWRPVRAFGLLPMAGALAGTMMLTSVIDLSNGQVRAISEAHHVLDVAGLALLWMLAGRPLPRVHHQRHAHVR